MSTDIARHWRLNAQRYRLIGQLCPDCNQKLFPPRPVCPYCAETVEPALPWMIEDVTFSAGVTGKIRQAAVEMPGEIIGGATVPNLDDRRKKAEITTERNQHAPAVSSPLAL